MYFDEQPDDFDPQKRSFNWLVISAACVFLWAIIVAAYKHFHPH